MPYPPTTERAVAAARRTPWYRHLYIWVLIAMALGTSVGLLWPTTGKALKPLGDAFVSLLTMTLAPLVLCMVVAGIGAVANLGSVGKVALRSLLYFEVVTSIALGLGLLAVNMIEPGAGLNTEVDSLEVTDKVANGIAAGQDLSWYDYILQIIPSNIIASLADGAILPILFFAILFGISLQLMGERGRDIARGVERLSEALFQVVRIVVWAAPVGVFGAMAFTAGNFGAASLGALAKLIATFYATSLVFVVVVLGGILMLVGLRPWRVLRYFKDEVLLALGASSSEVALPGIVRKLENIGVTKGTAGISVTAGYSFNLDGTCIYLTLTTVFIAQALGIDLSLGQQVILLLVMLLASKGTAGVTGGGFVMLTTSVSATNLIPVAGVMLVFGVDRFMSECRAVVNSLGNAVAGIVVARWQGEIEPDKVHAIMAGHQPGFVLESNMVTKDFDTTALVPDPQPVPSAR
ncbi:aerobic C4-dicarboxylate transport protein [Rhodococcus fascians]|uniref:cation:dicarboxylate symporter family transporter n=1 Tax=Nocardiaceae TaxID=85025 RepID=UPI002858A5BB|nr:MULTISPECIES: cation:dicarboxylase symporter family transporter [Rhodococcus]MDR6908516.1 aerobic C4-dicarboxylate transport protein [Rhodococcus sp. 3258]MDR6930667.1 aerobic C4-dicarboxylate transport protein [Rhodococcus fascians]